MAGSFFLYLLSSLAWTLYVFAPHPRRSSDEDNVFFEKLKERVGSEPSAEVWLEAIRHMTVRVNETRAAVADVEGRVRSKLMPNLLKWVLGLLATILITSVVAAARPKLGDDLLSLLSACVREIALLWSTILRAIQI